MADLYVGKGKGTVTLYAGGPKGVGREVGWTTDGYRDVDGRPERRWWAYGEDGEVVGSARNRALALDVVLNHYLAQQAG